MGVWTDHVVPRIVDRALDTEEVRQVRARVCAGLAGDVLEIGFGSGLNVPHYPAAVVCVLAVEPSDLGWRLAQPRVADAAVPVQRAALDGSALPLPDDSLDAALSTFTLCTIPDVGAALAEVRRVLRPRAALHFVEHGRAPDTPVRRWQERLEPLHRRIAGGCRLTRPIDELLAGAGFRVERLCRHYLPGEPRPFAHLYEGLARA